MSRKISSTSKVKLRGKRIFLRSPTAADFREYAGLMKISQPFFRELVGKFNGRKQFNDYLQRCARDDFYGFLI